MCGQGGQGAWTDDSCFSSLEKLYFIDGIRLI